MKKIMVIDDEKDLLALVKGYLKRAGNSILKKPFKPSQLLDVAARYLSPDLKAGV